jgi:transcriptional regulator with PAS, ATPase and Fis domain
MKRRCQVTITFFGHKKGAFTDARSDKKGFVDEAQGGTLFFDEIAEIPVSFQAKLLRFIESKKYMVLGDPVEKEANIRIIAATNRNLPEAINSGQFREDLYYRLQMLEINIPPLRERREDLKALVMENLQYLKGKEIGSGKDFWEVVRKPFLSHDLNRNEVKAFMAEVLERQSGKYKNILALLNIKEEDYKKFLNFLNDNDLKP